MKIYLDDERTPKSEGWNIVRDAETAIKLLKSGVVTEISLDHDLGTELTGYDVATAIEELVFFKKIKCPKWNVHSANPVGQKNITLAMKRAEFYEN
jgi:hypothetical protein